MAKCEICNKRRAGDGGLCYQCANKNAKEGGKFERSAVFCENCGVDRGRDVSLNFGGNRGEKKAFLCFSCHEQEDAKKYNCSERNPSFEELCMYKYREALYYEDKRLADQILKHCYQGGVNPLTFAPMPESI